jgi:GTP-binding protein
LLEWLLPTGRAVHVLLSKADKLSAQAAGRTLAAVRKKLLSAYPRATVQLFSSLKRTGIPEANAQIESWMSAARKQKAPAKGELKPGQKSLNGIKAPAQGGEAGKE